MVGRVEVDQDRCNDCPTCLSNLPQNHETDCQYLNILASSFLVPATYRFLARHCTFIPTSVDTSIPRSFWSRKLLIL